MGASRAYAVHAAGLCEVMLKKQGQIDPDIVTKRMILDMRRSEVAHRLIQASGDREVLEKEYAEIMEKLKNL